MTKCSFGSPSCYFSLQPQPATASFSNSCKFLDFLLLTCTLMHISLAAFCCGTSCKAPAGIFHWMHHHLPSPSSLTPLPQQSGWHTAAEDNPFKTHSNVQHLLLFSVKIHDKYRLLPGVFCRCFFKCEIFLGECF